MVRGENLESIAVISSGHGASLDQDRKLSYLCTLCDEDGETDDERGCVVDTEPSYPVNVVPGSVFFFLSPKHTAVIHQAIWRMTGPCYVFAC